MVSPTLPDDVLQQAVDTLVSCGYNQTLAASKLRLSRQAFQNRLTRAGERGIGMRPNPQFAIEKAPAPSYLDGQALELVSRPDNTFLFGASGDLHAASKYCRWDVREDLYRHFIEEGAQCSFDTGNWIDGDSKFNNCGPA